MEVGGRAKWVGGGWLDTAQLLASPPGTGAQCPQAPPLLEPLQAQTPLSQQNTQV